MSDFVNQHRSVQQAICLLVCLCAWRGPVPVLHDHAALSDLALQSRHSQKFHDGLCVEAVIGLHWHLAFPEDITGEQCPGRDESPSELPLFACASAVACLEFANASAEYLGWQSATLGCELDFAVCDSGPRPVGQNSTRFKRADSPRSAVTGVCQV
ncbi:MAG: hypothetical protein KDB01_06460 [Planctomycetaceae bacterium]|nr:hypothetical protein [Planctomycetaceae bacterium]